MIDGDGDGVDMSYGNVTKGYRIYCPTKRSISVERNIVFNENDVTSAENITLTSGDISVVGERDKDIQSIPKSSESVEDLDTLEENGSQQKQEEDEDESEPQPSNSIPFPSTSIENTEDAPEITNETHDQGYGRGQCARRALGEYRALNEGLVAAVENGVKLQNNNTSSDYSEIEETDHHLPLDFAFVGSLCLELKTLDEAL